MKTVKRVFTGFAFFLVPLLNFAATSSAPIVLEKLSNEKLVNRFYELKGETYFWFGSSGSYSLRNKVKMLLDSAAYLGLDKSKYHYNWIAANVDESIALSDSFVRQTLDRIYTDALISFCKDVYGGAGLSDWLGYDELKNKFDSIDNSYIIMGLSSISGCSELDWFIQFLEPTTEDYLNFKEELHEVILSDNSIDAKALSQSLNVLRWIKHYRFSQYSSANISEELQLLCTWLW